MLLENGLYVVVTQMSPKNGHYNNLGPCAPNFEHSVSAGLEFGRPSVQFRQEIAFIKMIKDGVQMPADAVVEFKHRKDADLPGDAQHIRYRIEMKPKVKLPAIETVEVRAMRKFERIILKRADYAFPPALCLPCSRSF